MKLAAIISALFVCITCSAQETSHLVAEFNRIETIRCDYLKRQGSSKMISDKAFSYILAKDTFAIPTLIDLLSDTSPSKVKKDSTSYYKKGDLAAIIINQIEFMPFAKLTQSQWCICCDCGGLPSDFLNFLDSHRLEFQKNYKAYFKSQERQKSPKPSSKRTSKKRKS